MRRLFVGIGLAVALLGIGAALVGAGSVERAAPGPAVAATPAPIGEQLTWDSLYGPYERVAFALAVVSPGKLYAGTFGHGIYELAQEGNWQPVGLGGPSQVRALAVLPASAWFVFAGDYGKGLYRRSDGANTGAGSAWSALGGNNSEFLLSATGYAVRDPKYIESLLVVSDQGPEWYGSSMLYAGDLKDPTGLVIRLRDATDPLSQYLRDRFSPYLRGLLAQHKGSAAPANLLLGTLVNELNGLLATIQLYDETRLSQVALSARTRDLLRQDPHEERLIRLNRLILNDAYAAQIGPSQRIIAGTHKGIWASNDLGDTWKPISSGLANTDDSLNVQALAYDPAGWLYAGTLDGLYRSRDGGQSWERPGPPADYPSEARSVLSLAVVTTTNNSSNTLWVGTRGAGAYRLDPPEAGIVAPTWLTHTFGFEDERARTIQVLLSAPGGVVYAGTVDAGVLEIREHGRSWLQLSDGLPLDSGSILALARDPANETLYAGTYGGGVYRLRSGQSRWEAVEGSSKQFPRSLPVQKMAFAGRRGDLLLGGLLVGGLYADTTLGAAEPTWRRLSEALPIGQARNIAGIAATGADRTTGVVAAGTGIFRSADVYTNATSLSTWQRLTETVGLPSKDAASFALIQGHEPDILYAALAGGNRLYKSVDGGARWLSARGDLTDSVLSEITCLAIGENDSTVYLGRLWGAVLVTRNGGETWSALAPITETIKALAWSRRPLLDPLLYGGPRQMLYALTDTGIWVSYDDGMRWQLRMRGTYTTLLADPDRPHVVYIAAPASELRPESNSTSAIPLKPELWISHDGGQTWRWAGPTPATVLTMALDPQNRNVLYAGTRGEGIFRALLRLEPQRFTGLAVALMVGFSLLLISWVIGVVYWLTTGLALGVPSGISILGQGWFRLAWLRFMQGEAVGYVANTVTPLTALERLTLAHAAIISPENAGVGAEEIQQALVNHDIPVTLIQVTRALNNLRSYRLIRAKEHGYCLVYPLLGRIALARFWDVTLKDQANRWARRLGKVLRVRYWKTEAEREKAIEEIRNESQLRAETREFFKQSGFETLPLETGGLRITSSRPEHGLLGAAQGIYVHLHTQDFLDADHIAQVQSGAAQVYDKQLTGKLAFLIASGPPRAKAGQDMLRLRQDQEFRIVPLAREQMHRSGDPELARQVFTSSLQRMMGNRDLFSLDSRHLAPLDFVGRERLREEATAACTAQRWVRLTGMFGIGKTALAWHVANQLPQTITAWICEEDAGLTCRWLGAAQMDGERPAQEALARRFGPGQLLDEVDRVRQGLLARHTGLRVLAVLDELDTAGSAWTSALAQGLTIMDGVSLLETLEARPPEDVAIPTLPVGLLTPDASAGLVAWLAAQMDLAFDEAALQSIVAYGGGHPLLLRQLARLAVDQADHGIEPVKAAHVHQARAHFIAQRGDVLARMWRWFRPEEQFVLRAATKPPVIASELLKQLASQGWLKSVDGSWQLFSPLLAAWLDAQALAS